MYPPRQEAQRGSPSKYVDRKSAADSGTGDASDAVGASACTACGRVPTRGWLTSAVRVEERVGLELNTCLEDFARLCNEAHTAPIEERRLLDMALIQCSAVRGSSRSGGCSYGSVAANKIKHVASTLPPMLFALDLRYLVRFDVIPA